MHRGDATVLRPARVQPWMQRAHGDVRHACAGRVSVWRGRHLHGWVVFLPVIRTARIAWLAVAVASLLACGSGEDRRPAPAPSPTVETPAPAAAPAPPARDRERDIHGLTVK